MEIENKYLREEYFKRINKVIDFIENNLTEKLTLKQLASVANFSEFHFHRIFKALVGESLNQFIRRIKLERIADVLTYQPNKPVSDIAYDFGFSSLSVLTRSFSDYFGMPPNDWRQKYYEENSKNGKANSNLSKSNSKMNQNFISSSPYFCNVIINHLSNYKWSVEMKENPNLKATFEVKEISEMTVAYIRNIGPYAGNDALFQRLFGKLLQWAGPRGLVRFPETQMLAVYHDNPDITDEEKLRLSCCISVPPDTKVDGEICKMVIPGGKYVFATFEILSKDYGEAWNMVYGSWLPESGYLPDDRPCFELYLNDPKEHPEGKHIVSICAPVKPM